MSARRNGKKIRRLKTIKDPRPADFTSQAAYDAYVHLLSIQRGVSEITYRDDGVTPKTLYEKKEAQKAREAQKKDSDNKETRRRLNKIASKPQYRPKRHRNEKRGRIIIPDINNAEKYKSISGSGATKIVNPHKPDDYRYTDKDALELNKTLEATRKYREFYGKEE